MIGRVVEEVFDCVGQLVTLFYFSFVYFVILIGFSFFYSVILTYFSAFDLAIVFCSYYCWTIAPQANSFPSIGQA